MIHPERLTDSCLVLGQSYREAIEALASMLVKNVNFYRNRLAAKSLKLNRQPSS